MKSKKALGAAFLLVVAMGIGGLVGIIDKNHGIINKKLGKKEAVKYETTMTNLPKLENYVTIPDYAIDLIKNNPQKETIITIGDFDKDGDLDIILRTKEKNKTGIGHGYYFENIGDGTFYSPRISLY